METEKETNNSFPSFKLLRVIPNADEFKKVVELLKQVSDSKNGLVDKNLQFGLIVWEKELKPSADYFVNLPRSFNQLIEFGKKTSIDLLSGFAWFFSSPSLKLIDNVSVLAGIKRPKNIIGYNSDIEFVNLYITVKDTVKDGIIVNNVPVAFQEHNEPFSVEKAKEISNYNNQLGNILVFGAGALGSKVIMNLARGGHTDMTIVDGDKLSPQNLVRHALLSGQLGKSKSFAVKSTINELYRHDTLPNLINRNIDGEEMFAGENRKSIAHYNWLFDFTASKRVVNFLARETINEPINICKGSLMNEGKLGVLLVEGKDRNPRVDDSQILLYDLYQSEKFVCCETLIRERGWRFWAAELKASREFIGFVGLHTPSAELPFSPCVEIGWRLAFAHWGKGLASEAARGALKVGFTSLDLDGIVSFTAVGNARSRAVYGKTWHARVRHLCAPSTPEGSALRAHCLYRLPRSRSGAFQPLPT